MSVGNSVSIKSKKYNGFQTFENCYLIANKENGIFFDKGDSGSGVFLKDKTEDKLKPLEIAFAIRQFATGTYVCKIDKILQEFSISVIEEMEEHMDTSDPFDHDMDF